MLSRRQFLLLAAGAAALPPASRIAWSQTYPSRPVRIIVGFPAGSASDILARLVAQWLSERLGQPFIVDNRPGAGGNIATEAAVRAPADGYTLLSIGPAAAINATLYDKLNVNLLRDVAPVASVSRESSILVVNPSVPTNTIPDFVAYAKARPGKLNMASAGIGTGPHVFGELFKMMAGVNLVHVPYRGAPAALTDLLSGQVQLMFATVPTAIEYVRAGTLRALAATTAMRLEVLPDMPTVSEFLPGYEASGLYGVGAPKNTPDSIIDKLNKEINAGLADPKFKARFADFSATVLARSPAEFGKLIADETDKWAKVVRFAGIKVQ